MPAWPFASRSCHAASSRSCACGCCCRSVAGRVSSSSGTSSGSSGRLRSVWSVEPTGRELVGGSYGLEVEMYWAGPADRWGNRDENLLRIDGLKRAFYQWGREPQTEELALADLAAILLAPDCAHGALRWV